MGNKSAGKDTYANMAIISVTESAANTLTFKKLETGIGFMEKAAWIINRVEYNMGSLLAANFNGDGDKLDFGISVANTFTTPSTTEITIIDQMTLERADYGTAAVALFRAYPIVKDFSSMPGGGILLPPNPVYLWARGTGLVAATSVVARIYYTILEMSTEDYWQLLEARRVLSS